MASDKGARPAANAYAGPDGRKVRFIVFYPKKREFWRKVMDVD